MHIKIHILKERQKLFNVHAQEFMDSLAANLHKESLPPETASTTLTADSLAGITAEHIFVLNLIPVGFNPPEELIEADDWLFLGLSRISFPYQILDALTQVAVRLKYRNAIPDGVLDNLVLEPAHLVSSPACNSPVIYCLALVWNHQILAYTDDLSKSTADRACSERTIETEKIFIRFAEHNSIRLKTVYELLQDNIFSCFFRPYIYGSVPSVKSSFHRRMKPGLQVVPIHFRCISLGKTETVYEKMHILRITLVRSHLHDILNPHHPVGKQSGISLFLELKHQFHLVLTWLPAKVCKNIYCIRIRLKHVRNHIIHSTASYLFSRYRRISTPYAGKDHPQIIIYLRTCSNGRPGITGIDLLLYSDSRWDTLDKFDIRFGHAAEKLTRIWRKTLSKTSLTLGKQCIKGKRRLSRTRDAGNDHELASRYLYRNILQIIYLRSPYYYIILSRHPVPFR